MKNIALIFGGNSTEREISIVTASQIEEMCDKKRYNLFCVGIDENERMFWSKKGVVCHECAKDVSRIKGYVEVEFAFGKMWKKSLGGLRAVSRIDCAVVACHGGKGENGELVAHLSAAKIKTSVGNVQALQIAMDKTISKLVLREGGVCVVDGFEFLRKEWCENCEYVLDRVEKLKYPVVVKPARQGSSVGIVFAKNESELKNAVELALKFDDKILVEKAVEILESLMLVL